MVRILYAAPESERDNTLLVKLQKDNQVTFVSDWLDFSGELFYCKDRFSHNGRYLIPRQYDQIFYDTRLCGEDWLAAVRLDFFTREIRPYFEKVESKVIILIDEGIRLLPKK